MALAGWRQLTGLNPVVLRWLSVLAFVIGAAALYRVGRRLGGSGILAMTAYAAFGFLIFLSTELRGYALLLALFPLAIWLALRYFDRPTLRRALLLGIIIAAMIYISMTSIPALGALALFTLIVYRRAVWRWILPGGIALLLALPELIQKASIVVSRVQATLGIALKPFLDALANMYGQWSGNAVPIWLALSLLAALLLIVRRKRRSLALALVVWSLLPVALYLTNGTFGFFNVRYAWWVMTGIALLLGVGLARLPIAGRAVAAVFFGGLMLLPIPLRTYQIFQAPLGADFDWLSQHLQPGDVLLVDPKCACGDPEVFDYYTQVYFPRGLTFITAPGDQRRIWYVTGASGATPDLLAAVTQGRVASIFVGPPTGLFRLYEAPPNPAGILFDNGMRFEGIEVLDKPGVMVYHEDEPIHVRLWWSADTPPPLDYSVGVFVIDDSGSVIAQNDAPPGDLPTSQWQPGQLYVEERTLRLPYPLPRAHYRLVLAVYWYGDGVRLRAPGVDASGWLPLVDFTVAAWSH